MTMKRKIDENGDTEGPLQKVSVTYTTVPNPYYSTVRMPARVGTVSGGGTWRGSHRGMQNYNYNNSTNNSSNHNMNNNRGYYRGNRGRVGHPRYNYDNNMQQFQQRDYYQGVGWHAMAQQYQQDQHVQQQIHLHQQQLHQQQHEQQQLQHHQQHLQLQQQQQQQVLVGGATVMNSKTNKRRPMSQSYPTRPWNKEDAERAVAAEFAHSKTLRNQSLIIRFPDPELNKEMVKAFYPEIENVHFQVPSGPRSAQKDVDMKPMS